jgi:aryl sulfotransferase
MGMVRRDPSSATHGQAVWEMNASVASSRPRIFVFWPFWENVKSWWDIRHLPNVRLIHFAHLKADMPEQIRQIATFLEISIDEMTWEAILEHCRFESMKQQATKSVPGGDMFWEEGAQTFIYQGTNGRWCEVMTQAEGEALVHAGRTFAPRSSA